jgi:hypothetical protein
MPVVWRALFSQHRRSALVSAIAVALALLLPTACSDEQPTDPRPDRVTQANLDLSCAEPCFKDNFTDTDGTLLENHVPDGGTNSFAWAQAGAGSPFDDQRKAEIRNNALTSVNLPFPQAGAFTNYITGVVGDAVEIEVDVFAEVSFTQHDVGITLRNQDNSGFNNYTIFWSIGGFGNDGRGSIVTIDSPNGNLAYVDYSSGPVPVGIHTMRAEIVEGGVINAYIDGALAATATHSSPLPPGRVGLNFGFTSRPSSVRVTSFAAGGRAPDVVRIEPTNGTLDVWPAQTARFEPLELKVGVYDAQGAPLPNRSVTLTLTATELTAGHDHEGGKPAGSLLPQENPIPTGSTGEKLVQFIAPTPSGPVTIRGTSSGAQEAMKTINVAVPGLDRIAKNGTHHGFRPSDHHSSNDFYMAPGALDVMEQIWKAYVDEGYPISSTKKFTITAAALVSGGLYDIVGNWSTDPGHVYHRQGGDMDFDDAVAEKSPQGMKKVCQRFPFGGLRVDCRLHNKNHFHAKLGPNR